MLLVPMVLVYLAIRWIRGTPAAEIHRHFKKIAWTLVILMLLILAGSGKLNVLFALLGVAIAFVLRLMPMILHYAPQLHRLWQQFGNAKQHQQQSYRRTRDGAMSKDEALQVLGLKPGASENDIIEAHRKLISKLHPDRGGSDYLATQINLAKKILLNR